jgi:hypothetical protein
MVINIVSVGCSGPTAVASERWLHIHPGTPHKLPGEPGTGAISLGRVIPQAKEPSSLETCHSQRLLGLFVCLSVPYDLPDKAYPHYISDAGHEFAA